MVFQYSKNLEVERKMQSLLAEMVEILRGLIVFAIAFVMRKSACAWRLSVMRRRSPGRGARARVRDMLSIEVCAKCRGCRKGADGRMMPSRSRKSKMTHSIYIEFG